MQQHEFVERLALIEHDELNRAAVIYKYVGRLQVTVDDIVLMKVLDGCAGLLKEGESLASVQGMLIAELVDRGPIDIIHDEVKEPLRRGAAIDDARDVDVVELAENAAFLLEALNQPVGTQLGTNDFDGADSLVQEQGAGADGAFFVSADRPAFVLHAAKPGCACAS